MLSLLEGLGEGDFVLALISGGASALLLAPVDGVSLAEKQAVNAALLMDQAGENRLDRLAAVPVESVSASLLADQAGENRSARWVAAPGVAVSQSLLVDQAGENRSDR